MTYYKLTLAFCDRFVDRDMFLRYTHFGVGHPVMQRRIIRDCESLALANVMDVVDGEVSDGEDHMEGDDEQEQDDDEQMEGADEQDENDDEVSDEEPEDDDEGDGEDDEGSDNAEDESYDLSF